MDDDLKALHDAVNEFLKARRAVKRTARRLRLMGGGYGGATWDRVHIIHQLESDCDSAEAHLAQAEDAILVHWEALKPLF